MSTPTPVLILPIGVSGFERLAQLASYERVDINTAALNLLMFALGRRFTRPAAVVDDERVDGTTVVGVTCLSCGRDREYLSQPRCACGGAWISGER